MSVISTTAPRLRLPDQVNIDFGPVELLGPAFLQLDRMARDHGVYLSVSHDLDGLVDVNQQNMSDWYQLPAMFDPTLGGIDHENGFWIYGVDDDGDIVMAQAARLYLWRDTNFAEDWEAQTFMYPNPRTQATAEEYCTSNCEAARMLAGRVCHTGALWLRSDYRRQGLASIMPRVVRAYALTTWYPEYMFSLVKTKSLPTSAIATRLYGWRNVDRSVQWQKSPHYGDLDFAVCWMTPEETGKDLRQFSMLLDQRVPEAGLV